MSPSIESYVNIQTSALFVTGLILGVAVGRAAADRESMRTVESLDLARYTGVWYEIARYPNRFQRNCVGDTTATYGVRPDGRIDVLNQCREKHGNTNTAKGIARVADSTTNAKLKVTFFWPFSGDYWVLDLGPDYEYAVVGEPSRKYVWILSRTPRLSPDLYERAVTAVRAAGYDPSRLIMTPQSAAQPSSAQAR